VCTARTRDVSLDGRNGAWRDVDIPAGRTRVSPREPLRKADKAGFLELESIGFFLI
jgi:hypothetical protein